jgi:hypothetical protein
MRMLLLALAVIGFTAFHIPTANAQQPAVPTMPDPIQNLVNEGAQARYLGKDYGLDAWLTIKNGQEQYFYVLPDQKAFLMGVLFDEKGKLVTINQVQKLRESGDDILDSLTGTPALSDRSTPSETDRFAPKSPSEQLFADIEGSNWVPLGNPDAPVVYSFIDPQCPHCHAMVKDIRQDFLDSGKVQLRMIPVGFKDETRAQAAFLLAAPNPAARWYAHLQGDETALPAKTEMNQQGVARNLAIMQQWDLTVTPLLVYRSAAGEVKIVRGKPKDMNAIARDLGAQG